MKRDLFYVWFIPLLWCGFTLFLSFHSGDEHGLFYLGSIAGVWVLYLHQFNSVGHNLLLMLPAGAITVGLFGLILDLLRVRKRSWLILFAAVFALMFFWQYTEYGSFERMHYKHRYVGGVVVATCSWGIYGATALAMIGAAFKCIIRKVSGRKTPLSQSEERPGLDGKGG